MELEKNINEVETINKLENEIFELKQKLEIAQAESVYQLTHSNLNQKSDVFGVVDNDFNLLSVNNQWNKPSNTAQGKFLGEKCYSVFCGLNEPCKGCTLKDSKSGQLVWYFLQPQLAKGKRNCNQNIINPLNRIKPFELSMKETDLFYEQLFESTGDSLLIIDCKGRVLKFTNKLCQMLSYSIDEFSKLTIFDIDDPTNSLNFDERIIQVEREKGAIFETDLISKKGKLIPVECSSSPIRYHNKIVFFVTLRNIEERKVAQKKLLESEIRFRSLVL